jgi:hypothetical protein
MNVMVVMILLRTGKRQLEFSPSSSTFDGDRGPGR